MSPAEFLPAAEESGLIIPIGSQSLREACEQLRDWQHHFNLPAGFGIHLNLSAKQFCHRGLVQEISDVLASTQLQPHRLTLEISEQVLLEHPVLAAVMLAELRDVGVQVSVNDFGSGFSSLRALRHFPVNALKLDRSFIQPLGVQTQSNAIVKAIVELADELDMDLVAVGVEDSAHQEELLRLGCRHAQGRFFYPPMDAPQFTECLR